MKTYIEILIDGLVVFISVFLFNYFVFVKNNKKLKKNDMPLELFYLDKMCGVDPQKINFRHFQYTYCLINAFIITTTYILVIYFLKSMILRILFGVVILILLIKICYTLLGKYYQYKEEKIK